MRTLGKYFLLLAVLLLAGAAGAGPGPEDQGRVLEDLQYGVDVMMFQDAVRARITLASLGGRRYRADLSGEAQGIAATLSGQRRDHYSSEMVFQNGKLMPVLYREEVQRRGKHSLKEYRFDYGARRLELWQWKENRQIMVKKWETDLTEPLFDPLSASYNGRFGFFGPLRDGETLRIKGIPYPKPEALEVRLGAITPEGCQAMVSMVNPAFENQEGLVFVRFDARWVPTQGWTRVLGFGKITGRLLPGSQPLTGPLPGTPSAAGAPGRDRGKL